MKPQQFNLELWLHLGKPDCVWTRDTDKVIELKLHETVPEYYKCLSGLIVHEGTHKLETWYFDGKAFKSKYDQRMFDKDDLMLHLEDKPKTFGIKKK